MPTVNFKFKRILLSCLSTVFSKKLFLLFIVTYFSLFYIQKTDLINADLGRHIINGRVIFKTPSVLYTNFYSYTQTNFPSINHHWGSGIIFNLIHYIGGFKAITIAQIACGIIIFVLLILIGLALSSNYTFILPLFLLGHLIVYRYSLRPELFSFIFVAIFLLLIIRYGQNKLSKIQVSWVILLQLLWVNMHIFFIFGPFILGSMSFSHLINKHYSKFKSWISYTIVASITCLINPSFIKGALTPFNILNNYGYLLAENQSVFFMLHRSKFILYYYFLFILSLSVCLIFYHFLLKKSIPLLKNNIHFILIATVFSILGVTSIRAFPLTALGLFPITCICFRNFKLYKLKPISSGVAILLTFLLMYLLPKYNPIFTPFKNNFGLGLLSKGQSSAEVFKKLKLKGPIFNNYDIGGYLIFNLFDQEKVFIDNRPEAYTNNFFKNRYIPMQENDEIWENFSSLYKFNIIFFDRHDLTPWGQAFLIKRSKDPKWIPIFVDERSIIFIKNDDKNKIYIDNFAIPRDYFTIK